MARISAYPKNLPVQPEDYWIGTRAKNLVTRNFTAEAVGEYINITGTISISACMLYKFEISGAGEGDITGVPNLTQFSDITSLNINVVDISGQNTVGFLEYIVGTEILISEQDEISTFGHYNIESYTQIGTTTFYTLNLTFIGGSGYIENKKIYNACSFVLSSENNNTTYDLDSVQNGANSDIRLIGSDSTTDIVTLEAGTNVTLTNAGNNILIDVTGLGTVTSVGQTHAGNAFSVTGSPITTSGVLAITLNGNATQYIDGAGDLQPFPAIPNVGDGTLIVQGTGVLNGTGTFTANQAGDTTISITHGNQSQTNTTPSTTLTHGGTFTALSANVSVNASGHVTGQELTTFTLPSDSQGVTSVNFKTDGTALNVVSNTVTNSGTMTGIWQGNASQYVNGEGDLQTFPTIPVVPTNIVETFSNNNTGTYVAYGVTNTGATGDINIGNVDLTAVDGTAIAGERYLTKSNTWATVASIPGTYEWVVAADSGSETILSGDTVNFIGGTNVTTSYDSGSNELTINSTDQFQGTVTDVDGGTYITTVDSTGPVVTVNHDLTSRTDTASAITPSAGDTITAVDSVTTNTTGHVEAINLKSVTLPTGSLTSEVVDIQVKNISSANGGINLVKGDPVYIYGSVGASARLYVDLADADSTATNNLGDGKMPCVGLLDQDLAPNGQGTATVVGKLRNLITSPIDGATPTENDTIYVKSGGGLTLTKPTGSTNLIQNVGQVGRVSTSSDGNIVVSAILRSNDVPNLPEGKIWVGDGNTIVSDVVYLDEANGHMGIGTTSPNYKLDVSGDAYIDETLNIETTISGTLTYGYGGVGAGHLVVGGSNFASFTPAVITLMNQDTTISAGQDLGVLQFGGKDDQTDAYANGQIICTTAVGAGSGNTGGGIFRFLLSGNTTGSGPTERMRITNTGNVGIGTTNPSTKLDVVGTIDTDNLTISGDQGTSGQVLTSTGSGVQWQSGGGGGATSLNGLSDVLIDGTSSYFVNIPSGLSGNPGDNLVIGSGTAYALTTGTRNTLVGHDAGDGITSGAFNTCVGLESGGNFNGNFNTTFGARAGYLSSGTKSNSVAIGYQSSGYLPSYTTAVGFRAGYTATAVYGAYLGYETMSNNTGSFNVGIGYRAGQSNTSGASNVYVGREAGKANTTSSKRTCVGEIAGSTSTGTNVTLIGYNSQPSSTAANNEITLGDSNVATLRCAVTTITSLSDERDKSEIKNLSYGLDFINSLQPREFVWDNRAEIKKQEILDENGEPLLDDDNNIVYKNVEFYSANKGKKDFGFIAQEVKELDNDTLRLVYSENEDKLEMSYGKLVPILVKAVQELKAEIETLKLQNK